MGTPWHLQNNRLKNAFNPRSREDIISMNMWNENVTKTDEASHRDFLTRDFMKKWPARSLTEIEAYIQKMTGPKKFYDRGRS